jgi:methylmalonyl-CoA mutase N-terminal domain/subunit
VAFTIADGIAYVDAAVKAGLDVDAFAPRLSFFFNSHNDLFEEAAKFRAARRVWAKVMKERFGAKNPKSLSLRFHTQTAGSTLTAQQPDNNVVRVTIQALAAVLGGTQSLHTNSKDEALALPTEDSVRVALRTQQIVAYESGATETIDPLAGSYYVESLTDRIQAEAEAYIATIDGMGGAVKAIERGYVQQEIQDAAYAYQMDIESGERVVVGMNKFQIKEAPPKGLLRVDPIVGEQQSQKLKELRAKRDNARVQASLSALGEAAKRDDNLMPRILEAVKAYATLGEICDVLRAEFGEYQQKVIL